MLNLTRNNFLKKIKRPFLLFFFTSYFLISFSQTNLDSLWMIWSNSNQADSNRLNAIKYFIWDGYLFSQPDSAFYFAQLQYDFAKKKGIKRQMASALNVQGISFILRSNYEKAIYYSSQSLKINEEIGDKKGIASSLSIMGVICNDKGDYTNAINYHSRSLKIDEEIGNKQGISKSLNNIGNIHLNQENTEKAIEYYVKSLKISKEIHDKKGIANMFHNIGNAYYQKGDYNNAILYHAKSLSAFEEIGDKRGVAGSLIGFGSVYCDQGNYTLALQNFNKALVVFEEFGDKQSVSTILNNIGVVYTSMGNYQKAIVFSNRALRIAQNIIVLVEINAAAKNLFKSYKAIKQYPKALEMFELYVDTKDSILSEENQRSVIQQEYQYNYEKQAAVDSIKAAEARKITEAQITVQKAEIKARKNQQYALFGGLFLVVVFAGVMYNRFRVTKKQKHIITQQKHLVEEKHKEITDSINYAERIQRSFLATTEMLDKYLGVTSSSPSSTVIAKEERLKQSVPKDEIASLPTVVRNDERNYFVFFRPKDVVSGDFYWAGELNNGNFAFSVADSTGHGVPGAIMSILNISSLEKSIEKETTPDKILNQTRRIIIDRLKKDGSPDGGKDGMDCSLLVINQDRTQLSFAAANNPVFIVRSTVIASGAKQSHSNEQIASLPTVVRNDGNVVTSSSPKHEGVSRSNTMELIEFKPDKMPVGKHENDTKSFTLHTATLQKGDVIYALTDGFPDQFGGDKGKKYMIKNLKELLLQIADLPMFEQEQKLSEEFDKWKGSNEQVDDVCIIGVRV